jgi:hypothetical protein
MKATACDLFILIVSFEGWRGDGGRVKQGCYFAKSVLGLLDSLDPPKQQLGLQVFITIPGFLQYSYL